VAGEFGLAYVWINRYNDRDDPAIPMVAELRNLKSLAEAAGG